MLNNIEVDFGWIILQCPVSSGKVILSFIMNYLLNFIVVVGAYQEKG